MYSKLRAFLNVWGLMFGCSCILNTTDHILVLVGKYSTSLFYFRQLLLYDLIVPWLRFVYFIWVGLSQSYCHSSLPLPDSRVKSRSCYCMHISYFLTLIPTLFQHGWMAILLHSLVSPLNAVLLAAECWVGIRRASVFSPSSSIDSIFRIFTSIGCLF